MLNYNSVTNTLTSKLLCVALNDSQQLEALNEEFNQKPYIKPPTEPVLYYKPRNTWSTTGEIVEWAHDFDGQPVKEMAVGGSLGVVIGKTACRVSEEEALSYVGSYTLVGDYSLPEENYYRPDIKGKCLDTSAPVGPKLIPAADIANPDALTVTVNVNGTDQSSFPLSQMQRSVAQLISKISYIMTLQEGEIIAVGFAGNRVAVRQGDQVAISCDEIGSLINNLGEA